MKFVPRSEATRQFIIKTTAAIFNKKGFAGTSMSDLTGATKLTKGSIYGNFENKEAVALAVFAYNATQRKQVILDKIKEAGSNKEKLMVYANIYRTGQNTAFTEGGCPLLNTGTEADDTHELIRKKVSQEILQWKKDIATIITAGIETREFRKDADADNTALIMIALIEGGIFIARTTRNRDYLNSILDTVKTVVEGIANKKG